MAGIAITLSSRNILIGSPTLHCGQVSKKPIVGSTTNTWLAREAKQGSFVKP